MIFGNYEIIAHIGSGKYGNVFKAKLLTDQSTVAIKMSKTKRKQTEAEMMDKLHNDNILRKLSYSCRTTIEDGITYYIEGLVLEYFPKDLHDFVNKTLPNMSSKMDCVRSIMRQLLNGLKYMHSKKIAHRDLKLENILIDDYCNVKICDLGMAKRLLPNERNSLNIMTVGYSAPETLIDYEYYDLSIDIWSVGCILADLCTGEQLFRVYKSDEELDVIYDLCGPFSFRFLKEVARKQKRRTLPKQPNCQRRIRKYLGTLTDDEKAIQLISFMLQMDPIKRISARQALEHSFFHACLE